MRLSYTIRSTDKKRESKRLRREDYIPAIIYCGGKPGENIAVKGSEFNSILKGIQKGSLPTTKFSLVKDDKERSAIVKEVQYDIVNYDVIHLDFEELKDERQVKVKVPIRFTGDVECAGVKLGGILRLLIRHLEVRCLPKDMPTELYIDVENLGLTQSKRLRDIDIPTNVKPCMNLREVAVIVAKR